MDQMLQIAKNLDPQILNIILVIVGGYGIFMSLQPTKQNADRSILTVGGIYNEGNTCFMNSVLQSFASMESSDNNQTLEVKQEDPFEPFKKYIAQQISPLAGVTFEQANIFSFHYVIIVGCRLSGTTKANWSCRFSTQHSKTQQVQKA